MRRAGQRRLFGEAARGPGERRAVSARVGQQVGAELNRLRARSVVVEQHGEHEQRQHGAGVATHEIPLALRHGLDHSQPCSGLERLLLCEQRGRECRREGDAERSRVERGPHRGWKITGAPQRLAQGATGRAAKLLLASCSVQLGEEQRDAARAAVKVDSER